MPPQTPAAPLTPIGPPETPSSLSYYNTTPESPDGSWVVYARFERLPALPRDPVPGSLWICRPDGSDPRRIADIEALTPHNAACQQWIDDRTLAFHDNRRVRVIDLDGRTLAGPTPGLLEHAPHGRRVLISTRADRDGVEDGAWELDADSGEVRAVCRPSDFARFEDRFPRAHVRDRSQWRVLHLQYNPSGTRIAMRFDMGAGEPHRYVMTCRPDGSDPVCFGPKPMHFVWFDDETLMGHDHQVASGLPDDRRLRRYTLRGECVETLAGPGNHLGAAPDRTLFASEDWYHEPRVRLRLYRRGAAPPAAVLAESDAAEVIWGLTFHANPSFSRDSGRVYFNHVGPGGAPRVVQAEVGGLR